MAARYRFSGQVGVTPTVYRYDTSATTDTPAALWGPYTDVQLRPGGYFRADLVGKLPQFRAAEPVLYRKPMLNTVAVHASAVAVAGVDRQPDPSEASTSVRSASFTTITRLTQAEYDALGTPDAATLYVVVG